MPAVSTQVKARNGIGRFIKACERAATQTVLDTAEEGARFSASFAPRRTGALAGSIKPYVIDRTTAVWGSNLKYALPQETGSRSHPLPAYVTFFWEREGRPWMTPDAYERLTGFPGNDPIDHPGNPAVHYLRDGYRLASRRMMAHAKANYPG